MVKRYIDFNTNKRRKAVNFASFGKDVFKLRSNNGYGKRMGNLRKGGRLDSVRKAKDSKKWMSRPIFFHRRYFVKI